jgi:outer membrane biosynthesis protein TonB
MDYREAKKIREKSFGTLLAEQEGGFGQSFKAALSQKTKAKVAGIKEAFDPLNIAKKLTGGSNFAPALLGKLIGADKKRIDYFSGVKPKHTASLESGGSSLESPEALESLGYIYKSLKQSIDDKHQAEADAKEAKQREDDEEDERNQELVKALTGRRKKKEKPEKEKPTKKEPKKKETTQKETNKTKETPKTTTKIPPVVTGGAATATVAGGAAIIAAGVAGTLSISKAIAQGESAKGSYNAANKGTKSGKIIGIKQPVNLEDMTVEEVMRRQSIQWGSPNESEKLFAVGKYQMIPTTLSDAVRVLNIDTKQKFNAQLQEKLFEEYLIGQKNPAIARYLNSPSDDPKLLYGALKSLSNEWASIADPDIPGGKTSHYGSGNKASISVEQMTALLKQDRMTLQEKKLSNPPEVPSTVSTGNKIDTSSKENKDLKTKAEETEKSAPVVNSNTTNQTNQQNAQATPPTGSDKPAYIKKVRM